MTIDYVYWWKTIERCKKGCGWWRTGGVAFCCPDCGSDVDSFYRARFRRVRFRWLSPSTWFCDIERVDDACPRPEE